MTIDLGINTEQPTRVLLLRFLKGPERDYDEDGAIEALQRGFLQLNIVITGRCQKIPAYFDLATVHSEVYCHKHYANQGVELKRGVDF